MPLGEVALRQRPQRRNDDLRKIRVLLGGLLPLDEAAQVVDADPEVHFLAPDAHLVEKLFVVSALALEMRGEAVRDLLAPRPHREEILRDHRLEHRGVARQVPRQRRRRPDDVEKQIDELGIRLEHREELDSRRKPGEELVEGPERLLGLRRLRQPRQHVGLEPLEYLDRALRAQRRIGRPAGDHLLIERIRDLGRPLGGAVLAEERFDQLVHLGQPPQQVALHVGAVHVHERGQAVELLVRGRQLLSLRVAHHLQPVLDLAVGAVALGQQVGSLLLDPALLRQHGEALLGSAHAQVGIAPSRNQLPRLGEELDLADAAAAQLHVVPRQADFGGQGLVLADQQPHVVRVLDRREVQMPAPHEGRQRGEEPLARLGASRAGPRLDVGAALPGPPDALVVGLRRPRGHAHRRHRRIRAQAQIGAEDVALRGGIAEHGRHPLGRPHEGRPRLGEVVPIEAVLVEQADEVDVRAVVEFPRPHLAHRQHEHAPRLAELLLPGPGKLAPRDLGADGRAQRERGGEVGEVGQRSGDSLQRPRPGQIGERQRQRKPPLAPAQRVGHPVGRRLGKFGALLREGVVRRVERGGEPLALLLHQRVQIGAASGGAADKPGEFGRQPGEQRSGLVGPFGVERARTPRHRSGDGHACALPASPACLRAR